MGQALRRLLPPPRAFCVVSRGRTGSTYLLSLLDSHPGVNQSQEVLGRYRLGLEDVREEIRRRGAGAYLERCLRRKGFERAVGFKVLYYQLEESYARRQGLPGLAGASDYLAGREDVRIIHLKRRNRLRRLVSAELASTKSEYWRVEGDAGGPEPTIRLSAEWCRRDFERTRAWEETYDGLFAHHPGLEVVYEDLAADPQRVCECVFRFLGLPPRAVSSRLVKQNTRGLREVVENYDELKAHFAGTQWEGQFDE